MPYLPKINIINRRFDFYKKTGIYLPSSYWDDLRFPASSINPIGGISDAEIDTSDTTNIGTLLFSSSAIEICTGIAQLPHTWREGTGLHPHIHWSPTDNNSGNVVWRFSYDIASINGNFSGTYTSDDITVATAENSNTHQLSSFAEIDMTGHKISSIIKWRISRIGNSENDTYSSDARLLEFDIHYEKDMAGSRQEYIK